ncbi:MAG: BamA/TamA family outer membrane protein [Cyanobacteria bacterium J06626_18]
MSIAPSFTLFPSRSLSRLLAIASGVTACTLLLASASGAQTAPARSSDLADPALAIGDRPAQLASHVDAASLTAIAVSAKSSSLKTLRLTHRASLFQADSLDEAMPPSTTAQDLGLLSSSGLETALSQERTPTPVVIGQQRGERVPPNSFFFRFGSTLPRPTALQGPIRPETVVPQSHQPGGIAAGVRLGFANLGGNNQTLSLGVEGGEQVLGFDLDFRQFLPDGSGYGVNFANQRGVEPEFDRGSNDVDTPGGDDPWVHRLGGGVEYFRPLAPDIEGAIGISYQRISVRDSIFTSGIEPEDELGNRLTVSDSGQDDLLTINLAGVWDRRDDPRFPTTGYRVLLGMDQSIPIGDADILFNRLSANYTQYVPLNLFGFAEGPRTLVLNAQGGTIIGDAPPYEAFSLGGPSSVRGYDTGGLGTGRSFIQATAEYRFPIFDLTLFREDIDVGGTLFFDYATDLGSGDTVIGEPAEVRDKPGNGFGYGVGLRALTPIGPVRLEFGLNDEGSSQVIFNVGDRF